MTNLLTAVMIHGALVARVRSDNACPAEAPAIRIHLNRHILIM